MGQKVNPIGFRLGVYRNWDARWYADKEYATLLREDLEMRRLITGRLRNAGLARIETERSANQLTIIIQTAKPGIVIGKQGQQVDALRDELERLTGKKVRVTIHEIKTPELDAKLVAESVASQLEKRIAFRRAMKQGVGRSMRAGAKGVRIQVSGRLGGSEMSRREWDRDGRVPLHTLRANVDYGQAEARTTFGRIGVTVWLYKGDFVTATGEPVLAVDGRAAARADEEDDRGGRRAATTPTLVQPRAEAAAEPTAEPTAEALSAAPDTEVAASEAPAPAGAEAPATDVPAPAETAPEPEAEGTVEVEADLDVEPEIEISPEEKIAAELGVPVEEDASPAQRTTAKRRAPARRATTPAGKGPRPKPPTGKAKPKAGDAVVDPEREEE